MWGTYNSSTPGLVQGATPVSFVVVVVTFPTHFERSPLLLLLLLLKSN